VKFCYFWNMNLIRFIGIFLFWVFLVSFWSCRTTPKCDQEGMTRYGEQEYNVYFVRIDSVSCPPDTCIRRDTVLGSPAGIQSYNATLITVLLDTTGNTGSNIIYEQPNSYCDNSTRKCGPYRFGTTDRVVGRDYNFVYSFIYNQTKLMGRIQVNFQMRADVCKTFFSKINYFFNKTFLPEYSLQQKPNLECFIEPLPFR